MNDIYKTTDDIQEGVLNQYYSDNKVRDVIDDAIESGDGIVVEKIKNKIFIHSKNKSTDDIEEGNRLYFTPERVKEILSSHIIPGEGIHITNEDGKLKIDNKSAYDLTKEFDEKISNLSIKESQIKDLKHYDSFNKDFSNKSTDDLKEGSNKYYSDNLVEEKVVSLLKDTKEVLWKHKKDRIVPELILPKKYTDKDALHAIKPLLSKEKEKLAKKIDSQSLYIKELQDESLTYLLRDGSRTLLEDWDAGNFNIKARSFESTVSKGTSPLIVESSTKVRNLNADLLDGFHADDFASAYHTHSAQQIIGLQEFIDEIGGGGGVTDHGALTGLLDDDHTQYIIKSPGTSARNTITSTSSVDGLTINSENAFAGNFSNDSTSDATLFLTNAQGSLGPALYIEDGFGYFENGNLGIGVYGTTYRLEVRGTVAFISTTDSQEFLLKAHSSQANELLIVQDNSGNTIGAIGGAGEFTSNVFQGIDVAGTNAAGSDVYHDPSNGTGTGGSGSHIWRTGVPATAPSLDSVTSANGASVSHTLGYSSGNGRLVVATVTQWVGADDITGVTYNGVAMTLHAAVTAAPAVVKLFYLKDSSLPAASGSYTVTATGSDCVIAVRSYIDVSQATSLGTAATATGTSGTPSVAVSAAAGDIVIDALSHLVSDTATVGAGQSEQYNSSNGNSRQKGSTEAGAASVTMSWSLSGDTRYGLIGVAVKAVGGSSENTLVERMRLDKNGLLTFADETNLAFSTSVGTKIGTSTSQKFAFWNATPVARPSLATDFDYTFTNATTDRTMDANDVSFDELADLVATMGNDSEDFKNKLKTTGLLA